MLTTKTCVTQWLFYAWGIHCVDDENTNDKNGNDKKQTKKVWEQRKIIYWKDENDKNWNNEIGNNKTGFWPPW